MLPAEEASLRVFTGVRVPLEIAQSFNELRATIPADMTGLRWTPPEKLHLTLVFLGSVKALQIAPLCTHLATVQIAAPEITLTGADFFSGSGALVLDIAATPQLLAVQEQVEAACERIGHKKEERPYRPHITLARRSRSRAQPGSTQSSTIKPLVQYLKQAVTSGPPFRFSPPAFTLYESRAGRYVPLQDFKFAPSL